MRDQHLRLLLLSELSVFTYMEREDRQAGRHPQADAAKRLCEIFQAEFDRLPDRATCNTTSSA